MKYKQVAWLLIIAVCSIFAACKKDKTEPTELSKLPAATQSGANTFGCLVNGKAWVAQTDCKYLCDAPFKLIFDASNGGSVFVSAKSEKINQRLSFSFDSTNSRTYFSYSVLGLNNMGFTFTNNNVGGSCGFIFSTDSLATTSGNIKLSKYDLLNGVISGSFDFTLSKSGCETITVTEGRFDKKL